jgi:phage baseplate assembly protein gpV
VVDLDVDASDVEYDIASVRWEVDGVLLDGSVEELEINAAHDIRVTVRDARGATTVDTHEIVCTTP